MKRTEKKKLLFYTATVIFLVFSSQAFAGIYDGGTYDSKKVSDSFDPSSLGPDLTPSGMDVNHFSAAPLGKPFYVVGEDGKCYWGNFSKAKDANSLIVYYSSPISSEHCVYQSTFSPKPSGYSIYVKEGGRCVPTHADVQGDSYDWVLSFDGLPLPLATCVTETISYGDNIDRKHKKNETLVVEKPAYANPPSGQPTFNPNTPPAVEVKPDVELVKSSPAIIEVTQNPVVPLTVSKNHTEPKKAAPIKAVPAQAAAPEPVVSKPAEPEAAKPVQVSALPRVPSSVKGPDYTLQLGSFLTEKEAREAISKFKQKEIDAFTYTGKVAGTTRYRVCSGHFSSGKSAKQFQTQIAQKAGIKDSFVQTLPKNDAHP